MKRRGSRAPQRVVPAGRALRPGAPRGRALLATAALLIMTGLAYLPAVRCGFVWDDDLYVQANPTVRAPDGLRQIWFDLEANPQYYPLVHSSYWIEYQLWGLNPAGFHVVNIGLHALGAVLAWRVLRFLRVPGAWAAAAIFALHPVQVESVAWITERKNVLSGVFYFAAALAYLRYTLGAGGVPGRRAGTGWYVAALGLFVCALLSKTVTCSLPAALLLILWWKHGRIRGADWLALAPFLALGLAFGLLTAWLERHQVGAEGAEWNLSLVERGLVAGRALWFYADKLAWPASLTFVYPRWHVDAGAGWQYVYPAGVLAVLLILWLVRSRIGRGPLLAVLVFAGTLLPALGFFDLFPMRYSFVADHFQYLASLGLIALAAAAGWQLTSRFGSAGKKAGGIVFVLVLAILGTLTWRQQAAYLDLEMLWRDTLRKNPAAWLAHNNLVGLLRSRGQLDEAFDHCRAALRLNPRSAEAHCNLAALLTAQGKLPEAIDQCQAALRLRPDLAEAYYDWAITLTAQGKTEEAISRYREALRISPKHTRARNNLAGLLCAQGQLEEAIDQCRAALRLRPDFAEAQCNLAMALAAAGRAREAVSQYRQALRWQPDLSPACTGLAWILATHPDADVRAEQEAIRLAAHAAKLTRYQDAGVLDTLAAAYASAGQFDQAVATAQRAGALAEASGARTLAAAILAHVELYQRSEAYRQPEATPPATRP